MQITELMVGDTLRIGPNIYLTVLEVRGLQVRLGIVAPSDTKIFRAELVEPAGMNGPDGDLDTRGKAP